jgi:GAF domain
MDNSPSPIRTSTLSALTAEPATPPVVVTSAPASVSAGIAAANAHLTRPSAALHFPGEEARQSLAEMAALDLDAVLQLLADRAQYITGASGAAIALRRAGHNDMICRASTGLNAPELGAVLSTEIGLSGESVRTRLPQRCNDAQNDPRVNREGCQRLGIASVVVMPILSAGQAIGVFELFSSKPFAFEERDLLALQRLSGMVELALKFSMTAEVPLIEETPAVAPAEKPRPTTAATTLLAPSDAGTKPLPKDSGPTRESRTAEQVAPGKSLAAISPAAASPEALPVEKSSPENSSSEKSIPEPAPKKPLFWSASTQSQRAPESSNQPAAATVPPVLRKLQKCQACGFPVSTGRLLCVECEEKKWRGQPLPRKI